MNISLTNELEQFVHQKVETGRYLSASEVIREALRLLEERDKLRDLKLRQLQADLSVGLSELDSGLSEPLDSASIKSKGRELLQERRRLSNGKGDRSKSG